MDVEVEKDEEEDILRDAELLCNCVTETEKSVGFKSFETIPLPKTLEEYNWLSLTKCIIYCHQYITDHNMVSVHIGLNNKSQKKIFRVTLQLWISVNV